MDDDGPDILVLNRRTKDLTGKCFGKWCVLKLEGYFNRNAFWLCRCECGIEKPVKAQILLNGTSTKCTFCGRTQKKRQQPGVVPHFYWRGVIHNANKNNRVLEVTPIDAFVLLESQLFKCKMTGLPIDFADCASNHLKGHTTASLDRIDSDKPYVLDNVQWVHKDVNLMKNILSHKRFCELCKAVAKVFSSDDI